MKIALNLSKSGCKTKPKDKGKISVELNRGATEIELDDLPQYIQNGYTFTCGHLNTPVLGSNGNYKTITKDDWLECEEEYFETGQYPKGLKKVKKEEIGKPLIRRYNICWTDQSLFGLDFDNEQKRDNRNRVQTSKPYSITMAEFKERCKNFGLEPVILYETFSSIATHQKFRALFVLDIPVTDYRARNAIQQSLLALFPECDISCKDASRMFFGTNKKVEYKSNHRLNLQNLFQSLYTIFGLNNNTANSITAFCDTNKLATLNGYPAITENYAAIAKDIPSPDYVYQYGILYFIFTQTEFDLKYHSYKNPQVKLSQNESISLQLVKKFQHTKNIDFDKLHKSCQLWREFTDGEWLYHHHLWGIFSNIASCKGGKIRFFKSMTKCQKLNPVGHCYTDEKVLSFRCNFNGAAAMGYAPQRCEHFCDYVNECEHGKNMLSEVYLARNEIRKLHEIPTITFDEGKEALTRLFNTALSCSKHVAYVKAPVGIGKSFEYTRLIKENALIALPTHKLAKSVANDFCKLGVPVYLVSEPPPLIDPADQRKYKKLTTLGNIQVANQFYKSVADRYKVMAIGKSLTPEEQVIVNFVNTRSDAESTEAVIICTHAKSFHIDNPNIKTVILDEDFFEKCMIIKSHISLSELRKLESLMKRDSVTSTTVDKLSGIIKLFDRNITKEISSYISPFDQSEVKRINDIIGKYYGIFNSEISDLFFSIHRGSSSNVYFIRTEDNPDLVQTSRLNNSLLKNELKYIVLSATASDHLYRHYFQSDLESYDVGNVENKGTLIQYYENSASRSKLSDWLNEDSKGTLAKIKEIVGDSLTLTYKSKIKDLKHFGFNVVEDIYLGNCSGYNDLENEPVLAIIGTPNLNEVSYLMTAAALGFDTTNRAMGYIRIKRNGYEFRFQTYLNRALREIHLSSVESELIQAVGRARLIRNDNTVILFSNFPLVGAQLKSYDDGGISNAMSA